MVPVASMKGTGFRRRVSAHPHGSGLNEGHQLSPTRLVEQADHCRVDLASMKGTGFRRCVHAFLAHLPIGPGLNEARRLPPVRPGESHQVPSAAHDASMKDTGFRPSVSALRRRETDPIEKPQ